MLSNRVYRGEREVASERFTSREARRYRRRMKKNRMTNGTNAGMIHGTTRHTRIRDPASRRCTLSNQPWMLGSSSESLSRMHPKSLLSKDEPCSRQNLFIGISTYKMPNAIMLDSCSVFSQLASLQSKALRVLHLL